MQDTVGANGVRWPDTEIVLWIDDGQREVVNLLPSAYTKRATPTTVAGTRQDFASLSITDGLQVINVVRNFNATGTTPGRAITVRPMAWINDQRPNWHNDTAAEAVHYFFDPADPKAFYVYPPASGNTKVELIYSAVPPQFTTIGSAIALDDIYFNALVHYVLFRAFSKNTAYTRNPALAANYYQLFMQSLGVKDVRVKTLDANAQMQANGAGVASAVTG